MPEPRREGGTVALVQEALGEVVYYEAEGAEEFAEGRESIEEIWAWHRALSSLRKAGWQLHEALEAALLRAIGPGVAMRLDDYIVRGEAEAPPRRCKDPAALAEYLGLGAGAKMVFRTTDMRIQGLRAYAESLGDDPDEIEDRFFEFVGEEGPVKLRMNRMEHAPWWSLDMRRGERRPIPPPRHRQQRRQEQQTEHEQQQQSTSTKEEATA